VQAQPLKQLVVRNALAPLEPLGGAAHASYAAAVEGTDAVTHVCVKRQHLAAKEKDGEDDGFIHQRFHTWRHIPGSEDGLGKAVKGGGGEADAAGELRPVR